MGEGFCGRIDSSNRLQSQEEYNMMSRNNNGRIYLWVGLATLALVSAVGFGASGALAGLPARVAAGLPMPAGGQQARPSSKSMAVTGAQVTTKPASPNSILYDQYNSPGANSTNSQDYEATNDAYDDQAADD